MLTLTFSRILKALVRLVVFESVPIKLFQT